MNPPIFTACWGARSEIAVPAGIFLDRAAETVGFAFGHLLARQCEPAVGRLKVSGTRIDVFFERETYVPYRAFYHASFGIEHVSDFTAPVSQLPISPKQSKIIRRKSCSPLKWRSLRSVAWS